MLAALLAGLLLGLLLGGPEKAFESRIGNAQTGLLEDRDRVDVVFGLDCLFAGSHLLFEKLTAGEFFLLLLDGSAKLEQRALVRILGDGFVELAASLLQSSGNSELLRFIQIGRDLGASDVFAIFASCEFFERQHSFGPRCHALEFANYRGRFAEALLVH